MPTGPRYRLGGRLLFFGWLALLVAAIGTIPAAKLMVGGYGDGPILIRPWIWTYNAVILISHLLCLAALFAGALITRGFVPPGRRSLAATGAALCWGLALAAVAAMLLFPRWLGLGPWAPGAPEVRLLRALVFAPGALRSAGLALLAAAIATAIRGPALLLLLLALLDVVLSVWKWIATPKAVVALLHPYGDEPLLILPFALAGVLFLLAVRQAFLAAEPGS